MTTIARAEAGSFCFRCSARDPSGDPRRNAISVHAPWPMLTPEEGFEYVRSNPLLRVVYAPTDLHRVVNIRAERKQNPRPLALATEADLAAFRDWMILIHEFGHLYYLEWTPAKELARTYLTMSFELVSKLITANQLPDWDVGEAWRELQIWTQDLAQIEQSIAFVEELVATAIAFKVMEMHTQPGGLWAGFGEVLEGLRREFVAAEEEQFEGMGFGLALTRFEPLMDLMYGNQEFVAFMIPLLQPVKIHYPDSSTIPFALDARANLDVILNLVAGVESTATAMERLRELEQEITAEWRLALGLLIAYSWERMDNDGDQFSPRAEIAQMLWRSGRGDLVPGNIEDAMAEATRAAAAFRDRITTGSRLGLTNLVLLQPQKHRGRLGMSLGWWDDEDTIPETVRDSHLALVVLESLREQLLTGRGTVCPKNPDGSSYCHCSLAWRKALLRFARLAQSGAFGPGDWAPLPCRRR